ncbi:type 1 glutamine amidotransferase family protein [Aestuariivirga sp.]|uniref:type 1 glutamine amidotransferase family protein n=1 Tax=Aestuariivirga sp. TaxID=2650926 RepID=UPI0039E21DAF
MPKRAYVYLPETFADWETGFLAGTLRSGEGLSEAPWEVYYVSEDGAAAGSIGGLRVMPDLAADHLKADDGDLLVLCGGDSWNEGRHAAIIANARQRIAAGKPVAAICAATVALARAGCLETLGHTSNDLGLLKQLAPGYGGEAHYRQRAVVRDGMLVTATGVAPVEFAAETLLMVGAMTPELAEAWKQLYTTHEPAAFHRLMDLWQANQPAP